MQIESIKPYNDRETTEALLKYREHPMMLALLDYAFPNQDSGFLQGKITACTSTYDFHSKIIYPALQRVIAETTEGLSTSGFDDLDPNQSYLYISNHRDIVLDTSLTNMVLLEKKMVMTASAIGDNLVQEEFLMAFSKMNRNFLVKRSLTPREMLMSSINLSKYIHELLNEDNRSVWLAQKEGRTKDGNDQTHQGVLKMLTLGKERKGSALQHLKALKIVPLSISYEYDPTDYLKMPALLASYYEQEYVKTKDEDFNNILTGVLGQKKRIHIAVGEPIGIELDEIETSVEIVNQQLKGVTELVTKKIQDLYKLWPTNYIAYDMLNGTDKYSDKYTEEQKLLFEERVAKKTDPNDKVMIKSFLSMYANPVVNSIKLQADTGSFASESSM